MIYQSQQRLAALVEIITESLSSKLEPVRQTSAALASNLALYLPRSGSDEEIQILSSMIEYIKIETSEECLLRMLLTIFRMVSGLQSEAKEVVRALEPNFDSFANHKQLAVRQLALSIKSNLKL